MSEDPNQPTPPAPEELSTADSSGTTSVIDGKSDESVASVGASSAPKSPLRPRNATYRPSHKATFIGIGIVLMILTINAAVIAFLSSGQGNSAAQANRKDVTLSSTTLNGLGVSRNSVGSQGTELTIGPDTQFNGKVVVVGDTDIQGELKLKGTFSAPEASFVKLKAGDASFTKANINGDATASSLVLRKDMTIAGTSRVQGPAIYSGLVTVNNSLNVAGNLSVGGVLSTRNFQANSLVSTSTLTIGGHIITRGSVPSISKGGGVSGVATVSGSGNDAAGTVAITLGVGASASGTLASVSFNNAYSGTPRVIVSPFDGSLGSFYVEKSSTGFSVRTNSTLGTGSYGFDYFVVQ